MENLESIYSFPLTRPKGPNSEDDSGNSILYTEGKSDVSDTAGHQIKGKRAPVGWNLLNMYLLKLVLTKFPSLSTS